MRVLGEFPDLNILEPKSGVVNAVNNNQMQNGGSNETSSRAGDLSRNLHEPDLEMHGNIPLPQEEIQPGSVGDSACEANPTSATNVVTKVESHLTQQPIANLSKDAESTKEDLPHAASPKMGYFSRTPSAHEQCRVCQQEKEEGLIDLGCQCKGGLAKAHRSCIVTWFHTKGSNKCEICQVVAVNVTAPQPECSVGILCLTSHHLVYIDSQMFFMVQRNYWVWRINPRIVALNRERSTVAGTLNPYWWSTIGYVNIPYARCLRTASQPDNWRYGTVVIVVIGLGTALRLAVEFYHEWSTRRALQRVETNATLGYHTTL
ncbi:March9 [Gossypium australe]|uniref:March9 n=1 Tax=Gossypium australe TaxID=47621 RepID=A0A5B6UJB0_9ROSI|nr:March9 [Gossypium australe]